LRIAVIGNSHAGAVKQALAHDASRYPHTFDFFVQTGGNAPKLELRDGCLYPADGASLVGAARGETHAKFDPASCDAILFVALGLAAHRQLLANHLLNNFLHAGFAAQPYQDHQSVSGDVLALMIERRLLTQPSTTSLQLTRSVFAGPLVIVTTPLPGSGLEGGQFPCDLPAQYGPRLNAFLSWYFYQQVRVIAAQADRLGAMILPPPEEFLVAGVTPDEFCSRDRWHMSRAYGHIILADALRLIGAQA
jgi:hypothetical protein